MTRKYGNWLESLMLKILPKDKREFENRAEILQVQRDMANGRILWQVTEKYEIERSF